MEVTLGALDDAALADLVRDAVPDTEIEEVMPAGPGAGTWDRDRLDEFLEFQRARRGGLDGPASEVALVVRVDGVAAGVLRLQTVQPQTLEVGIWLARHARGRGVGGRALAASVQQAVALGARTLVAETTAANRAAVSALVRLGAQTTPSPDGGVHARLALPAPGS